MAADKSLTGPGGYMSVAGSNGSTLITPPDLDLAKAPVGERGVSSLTAELPQHMGVEGDGLAGKALAGSGPGS